MVLSDLSIKRPVFITMVIIGLMTLGLLAVRSIGVDLFPDVAFPIITVQTVYPGAGPEEVERQVTKNIEEAVASVNGVDQVRSFSRDSVSVVIVQFKLEADIKAASTDVRDKVNGIRPKLPTDIKDPVIQRVDPTATPILTYALSSKRDPAETRRIAEDIVKLRLEAIDGVAAVNVIGGREREVHVFIDRQKLEAIGLTLAQVAQQLGQESFDLPAGRVTQGDNELSVKTVGRFHSIDELGSLVVASLANGSQVHLREVARLEDGYKEVRTITRLDGEEAVTLEIQKQGGSNTVAISDAVYKVIDKLKATKALPDDVKVAKAADASVFVRRNIEDVTESIVFGGAMAILVVFLFMLDWRSTLITSLSLPTSVVTTFLAMWWLGFTFNLMSLLALSLAIGLLIDDAVVVRENIYRHMEMGQDPITAAREATSEIGLAVMATTFTIVAVFVPVAFMGGMIGKFFKQFGLTVAAATLVSLFISFTLDPMLSAHVFEPIKPGHHHSMKSHPLFGPIVRFYDSLDAYYLDVLKWALKYRKTVIFGAAAMFFGSMYLTKFMGKEFVNNGDRGEFRVNLEMPAGTSIATMEAVTRKVEGLMRENSHVKTLFTTVGPSEEVNKSSIRVQITKPLDRPGLPQTVIQDDLRKRLATVPSLISQIMEIGMVEGAVQEYPVTLFIRGTDYGAMQAAAAELVAKVKAIRGAKDVDISFRPGKAETNLVVNRARAADLGVSLGTVAQTVRLALEGQVVAKFQAGDRDVDIRMQLSPDDREGLSTLGALTVPATGQRMGGPPPPPGMQVKPAQLHIAELVDTQPTLTPATIERQNRQRQIVLNANISERSLGEVAGDIQTVIDKMDQRGCTFVFGGQTERMQETFTNMLIAMLVAVLFIYFVLASQFESFIHPFTIMLALPLGIVGAFLLLFLANRPIGMSSMIGIILLMGLVTKNAILLVDYTNEARERGMAMVDALLEAGPTRLRPILMTSAAMVLGMLPVAMAKGEGSEFRAPMGIAVIGGVVASTFLTLLVVPVVYTWMDGFTSRGRKEAKERKAKQAARDGVLEGTTRPTIEPHEGEALPSPLRVAGEEA